MKFFIKLTPFTAILIFAFQGLISPYSVYSYNYLDYPYSFNFLTIRSPLMPLGDEMMEEGRWSIRANMRWVNVWSYQRNYFIVDGEEFEIEPHFRYALTDHSQIGISIPLQSLGGGMMDGSIEAFHRGLGVTQGWRDQYDRNVLNVSYEPYGRYYPLLDHDLYTTLLRNYDYREYPRQEYDQPFPLNTSPLPPPQPLPLKYQALLAGDYKTYFLLDQDYPYITDYGQLRTEIIPIRNTDMQRAGDPRLHYQTIVYRNLPFGDYLTGGLQLKVPVYSGTFFSTPGIDAGIFLTLIREATQQNMGYSVGVSYTKFALGEFYGIHLPPEQWTARINLEKQLSRSSIFGEYVYFTKPTLHMGELSKEGHQIAVGFRKDLKGFNTTFAVIENVVNYGVTPDIGFQMSSEMKF